MLKIKKVLDKNNVPYEEFNFDDYDLIKVYEYSVDGLSDIAKLYSLRCTILKFKNQQEYEVGCNFNFINNNFETKKYRKANDIYNELIKNCYLKNNEEIMNIEEIGKIEYI